MEGLNEKSVYQNIIKILKNACYTLYIVLNSSFYLNSHQENIIHGTVFAHGNPFGRGSAISTVISLLRVVTSIVIITIT